MKIPVLIIAGAIVWSTYPAVAQNTHFTTSGTIEFEKTVNMFALVKRQVDENKDDSFLGQLYESYKKTMPQFKKLKSALSFAGDKTKFVPAEAEENDNFFGNNAMVTQNNTIFTDLDTHAYVEQKTVFESKFLVKDTTRKIKWKITDETRDIAGYMCRRANAVILDSIYVVAFYTDKIPVSGGPETFTGLPGMILGVALPHENITWFATKVTDGYVDPKILTQPAKGKPVNNKELRKTLDNVMKDWGSWGKSYLKAFSI